ncbi:MAG: chemotaxis protein CheW [Gammaproteobacteria bacterium]|nr:chemotaxis protein CheW [Gammaproteobacteria bacterium]
MAIQQFLVFFIADEAFAISSQDVIEILPMVNINHVPKTEDYISGMMNYRGTITPVIDLPMLLTKKTYLQKVCTRIIIINNKFHPEFKYTGLIAEKVIRTTRLDTDHFTQHTLVKNGTHYLGNIAKDKNDEIQIIDLEQLLPEEVNNLNNLRTAG